MTKKIGSARHLIVTPEQFFETPAGHLTRMGRLIRNSAFRKHITYSFVDEIHTADRAGIGRYGLPPFRAAWGRLSEVKKLFPDNVRWMGLTATCPPHIQKSLETLSVLSPGYETQRISVNRPDTIYATHQVVGSLKTIDNYYCFLDRENPTTQRRVLIFCDNKKQTRCISRGLTAQLPEALRRKNIIMHYHGGLSARHLSLAHKWFTEEDGCCRILVATSAESTVSLSSVYCRVWTSY